MREKPTPSLYLFSLSAKQLRSLSGVFDRRRDGAIASGIQRAHEIDRSEKIQQFVKNGYPFCELSAKSQQDQENDSLKKPGWLPTAIVVNILGPEQERRGKKVSQADLISISDDGGATVTIRLPDESASANRDPKALPPIEIIDGQHRLFAFEQSSGLPDDFQLPVVAFSNLDVGWQAYLFWSINVSPKKINASHAYDLFPLLRTQDWLEKSPASHVYREARAQELTEILYRHEHSPWYKRVNMLGERKSGWVTQAGWVKSLFNSFLSPGLAGRSRKGLFASNLSTLEGPLEWNRPQQAAFIIFFWDALRVAVKADESEWSVALRKADSASLDLGDKYDAAYHSGKTLLNQEQGVRAVCLVLNDIFFYIAKELHLQDWCFPDADVGETRDADVENCIAQLQQQPFSAEIQSIANAMATFDWRSFDAPGLSDQQKLEKAGLRGTGGYGRLRNVLLDHISADTSRVGVAAKVLYEALKAED